MVIFIIVNPISTSRGRVYVGELDLGGGVFS